ncbi:hypothetical protein ES703_117443 [subsurface metagenome]
MKTQKDAYVVRDQFGVGQGGKTVIYYPWGTMANGSTAIPGTGTGKYVVTIDPTSNNNKICRYYDIYVDGEKHDDKVFIGEWVWFVKLNVDETPKVVLFSDEFMKDENNESLPTTIPNVKITRMYEEKDLPMFIHTVTDIGFTIEASSGGGVKLPVDVWLKNSNN